MSCVTCFRGRDIDAWQQVELSYGDGASKGHLYGDLLRAMLTDQIGWVRNRGHRRQMTEENGRDALRTACEADRLAHAGMLDPAERSCWSTRSR